MTNTPTNKTSVKNVSINKSKDLIFMRYTELKEQNLQVPTILDLISKEYNFKELTPFLTNNQLIIKVQTLIDGVPNMDLYTAQDAFEKMPTERILSIKDNRLRVSFKAINPATNKHYIKKIEFGVFCKPDGETLSNEDLLRITKEENVAITDLHIKFSLNYYFKDFVKKLVIYLLSNSTDLKDAKIDSLFTFEEYLNTSKSQFNHLKSKEAYVLENLRRYIYDRCIKHAKLQATNLATNSFRQAGSLEDSGYEVFIKKYGALFLVNQYLKKYSLDHAFYQAGLNEREVAFITEQVAQTIMFEYRTNLFTMIDKSNFSISGYVSSSIATDFASKLEKEGLFGELNQSVTNKYFREAIRDGKRINVLLDSTIIFSDGSELFSNKDTYSNTKGFGRGVKAILLMTEEGFPIIFDVISGNEPDVVTVSQILDKLQSYCTVPKDQITIVCDAGYFSKSNILYIINRGFKVNIVGKDNTFIREMLKDKTLADFFFEGKRVGDDQYLERVVPLTDYISSSEIKRFAEANKDQNVNIAKIKSEKIKVVFICNLKLKHEEYKTLLTSLENFKSDLENNVNIDKLRKHSLVTKHKVFTTAIEDDQIKFIPDKNKADEVIFKTGINSIFSTLSDNSYVDIVNIYHSRINIEVMFKITKQLLGLDAVRVHREYTLRLKIFIIQIAIGLINDFNRMIYTPYQEGNPLTKSDFDKLIKEFPNVVKLFSYVHQDLSFEEVNKFITLKKMNKFTRNILNLIQFPDPIETEFVKNSYSYRNENGLLK